ncbi:ATP-dependent DNA helicase [Trichonephila clavipes]|nr:ATP-dependent DNA helicase [Trichonephila clavipes]
MYQLFSNFCTDVQTENELNESVFLDILYNYLGNDWLCNPVTWIEKNVDVDENKLSDTEVLPGDLMPFKSIETIVVENETVIFLNPLVILGMPPHTIFG